MNLHKPRNIAVVEDHAFVGQSLIAYLKGKYGDERHFPNGESLQQEVLQSNGWQPDLIITDLLLQGTSGVALIKLYKTIGQRIGKDFRIVVLSGINEPATIRQLVQAGAHAYLSKEATFEELSAAIEAVTAGKTYIMDRLKESVLAHAFCEDKVSLHLSPQQHAILSALCSGKTIAETAGVLHLSVNTARTYQQNIMRKFGVSRTSDLILFAIKNGLYQV